MNRRWICSDVWMDILPSFNHAQLGLKMALLSDRFDILVDKHFDGKSELTIWRRIRIEKDKGPKAKLLVYWMDFPMPDRPLPTKIRFKDLQINYIIHRLSFDDGDYLDNLRRRISPTILTDLDQLHSIDSGHLCPEGIADFDVLNPTAGQALTKWLHTPSKDGQPKNLYYFNSPRNLGWVNSFKETFRRATTSVSYHIQFYLRVEPMPIEPFELVNEVTNEKLTLTKGGTGEFDWLLERCPIIGETAAAVQKQQQKKDENSDANLNKVFFRLYDDIGPLSPPGQSNEKVFSFSGSSDQRKKKK